MSLILIGNLFRSVGNDHAYAFPLPTTYSRLNLIYLPVDLITYHLTGEGLFFSSNIGV